MHNTPLQLEVLLLEVCVLDVLLPPLGSEVAGQMPRKPHDVTTLALITYAVECCAIIGVENRNYIPPFTTVNKTYAQTNGERKISQNSTYRKTIDCTTLLCGLAFERPLPFLNGYTHNSSRLILGDIHIIYIHKVKYYHDITNQSK